MKVLKVCLTGGPCGGKTTSINAIEEEFIEKGYHVIIVPEAATILINSGIRPFGKNNLTMYEFQKYVMSLQVHLEELADQAAEEIEKPTIIICDRGLMDDKAYVSNEEFSKLIKTFKTSQFELLNRYDLVMHLKTAADGKEEFYTTSNNSARTETIDEAREKDQKTLQAWLGHDNLKIIGNDSEFSEKIENTIKEIYYMLKLPYPIQRQEKYLVESLDTERLLELKPVIINIEQHIKQNTNEEEIYRKSSINNETKYTKIRKKLTGKTSEKIVIRKNITKEEYIESQPINNTPIKKIRYCFSYLNQYFRLDIFDDGLKILEIEDASSSTKRKIPEFITIIDNATNLIDYQNSTIYMTKNEKKKIETKKN